MAPKPQPVRVEPEADSYPHYDHKSRECFLNLERTHIVVRPVFERLFRPYGLSGSTFNILMILRSSGTPLAPHAIGKQVVVTRPTVTGLLNSLESQGLIRRDADPGDGRRARISLTKAGRDRIETLLPAVFALEKDLFAELSAREKETLITLLAKVQATAAAASREQLPESDVSRRALQSSRDRTDGHAPKVIGRKGESRGQVRRSY